MLQTTHDEQYVILALKLDLIMIVENIKYMYCQISLYLKQGCIFINTLHIKLIFYRLLLLNNHLLK